MPRDDGRPPVTLPSPLELLETESLVDVLQKIDEAHREIRWADVTFFKSAALSRSLPQHSKRFGNEEQKTNMRSSDLNQSDQTTPDMLSPDWLAAAFG